MLIMAIVVPIAALVLLLALARLEAAFLDEPSSGDRLVMDS